MQAILDAAELLLTEVSLRRLTTNAIARRAGVSVGSLYQYFPDKHAVLAEAARRIERRGLGLAQARAMQIDPTNAPHVVALWTDLLLSEELGSTDARRTLLLSAPPFWSLAAAEETDASVEALLRVVIAALGPALRPADPDQLAFVAFHAIEGVVECALIERPDQFAAPVLREELFQLCWRFVTPDPQPREHPNSNAPSAPPPRARPAREAPRRAEPTSKRGHQTVAGLLSATETLLLSDGVDALSARRIAARAGVSAGTLYRYFPDIEALLAELARRQRLEDLAAVRDALADAGQARLVDSVRAVVRAMLRDREGSRARRYAVLARLPRSAYDDASRRIGEVVLPELDALFAAHPEVRDGPEGWLSFVVSRALERTLEAAVLRGRDPESLEDALVELASRYLRTAD